MVLQSKTCLNLIVNMQQKFLSQTFKNFFFLQFKSVEFWNADVQGKTELPFLSS